MDYSALSESLTKEHIEQFKKQYPTPQQGLRAWVVAVASFIFMAFVFLVISIGAASGGGLVGAIVCLMIMLLFIAVTISIFSSMRKKQLNAARVQLFAERNGLTYSRGRVSPSYAGMFFSLGINRTLQEVIGSPSTKPPFEIGNYSYVTRNDNGDTVHPLGYIRIQLGRNLPHMVLDGMSNNAKLFGVDISNLPVEYQKNQKLQLEGDFNKHFSLYAPKQYERDALYIFTPDLMALMIDNLSSFDAEIVDNQLFIYRPLAAFTLSDAALLERLFAIVRTVGDKAASQTDYYADERVGRRELNEIAIEGKRLRKRYSAAIVIAIVLVVITVAVNILTSIPATR